MRRSGGLRRWGRQLGPYLMLEILLPGGTLMALLLFIYRRRKRGLADVASRAFVGLTRALASVVAPERFVLRPCCIQPAFADVPSCDVRTAGVARVARQQEWSMKGDSQKTPCR
ncbi:MAG: hypothetical protein ACREIB_13945 [Pseudomonadota bacterium]